MGSSLISGFVLAQQKSEFHNQLIAEFQYLIAGGGTTYNQVGRSVFAALDDLSVCKRQLSTGK